MMIEVGPPLMRQRPPEVWSHLVAFVHARLAEPGNADGIRRAFTGIAADAEASHNPRATGPGDSDIDTEDLMWHVASAWREHPDFPELLGRLYDRWHFEFGTHRRRPDREQWIREWKP